MWWLRLGIGIERIKPGNPQQNGRPERMHLTLKKEATKPPAKNLVRQQEKFDRFIEYYNEERPHQALNGRCPASSCVAFIHDCVILLVITTVPERPIWLASVAQLTKVCGFIGRR